MRTRNNYTIQLESGGRRDIDIDLITDYGREAQLFEIPPMPGGNGWNRYKQRRYYETIPDICMGISFKYMSKTLPR